MLTLILFLVVGAVIAYFAQYNVALVSVNFGQYVFPNIPLFYVIIGSVVTGLTVAYVIYLLHAISTTLKLRSKDKKIRNAKDEVLELTKRVHQLELENEKLKGDIKAQPQDPNAL